MRAADWALLACTHTAAVAFGCMAALLWLPPDGPSLLLGLVLGVTVSVVGFQLVSLAHAARGRE